MHTTSRYSALIAAGVFLLCAAAAQAQDVEPFWPAETPPAPAVDQVLYKGVVGNLLEAVPLEPEKRVQLQRTNAVVSNVMSARSLAMLLGVANPVFLIGGLAWGIWAASQIKPAEAQTTQLVRLPPGSLCVDGGADPEPVNVVLN